MINAVGTAVRRTHVSTDLARGFGDAPRTNGLWLIGLGLVTGALYLGFRKQIKSGRITGGPKGRAVAGGVLAIPLIILGAIILIIGH